MCVGFADRQALWLESVVAQHGFLISFFFLQNKSGLPLGFYIKGNTWWFIQEKLNIWQKNLNMSNRTELFY